jgi:hypothetical protein
VRSGGRSSRSGPEICDDLRPLVDEVEAGRSVHMDDITLVMERHGHPEETHFAFSYTPVRDGAGQVAGIFCPCTETTKQVLAERRIVAERERLTQLFDQAPGFMACCAVRNTCSSWSTRPTCNSSGTGTSSACPSARRFLK